MRSRAHLSAVPGAPGREILDRAGRAEHLSEVLRALGHPIRLRLVAALARGESRVTDLAERVGTSQPIASQQLRILRMSRLVGVDRRDGAALYRLLEPQLVNLLRCMDGCRVP